MRQYGEVPPWLAADNTPKVSETFGLGTGGGASVSTADSSGFGDVFVNLGPDYNKTAGHVTLVFPAGAPPTLFISGDEGFGPLTQSTSTNQVQIAWGTAHLVSGLKNHRLHYEWATSQ